MLYCQFFIVMQRPARSTAGIAAPHFSQDESLYAAAQKRQRVELRPCLLCDSIHRSDKEREKCRNTLVAQQKKAHKEQAERQKVQAADERRAKRSRKEQAERQKVQAADERRAKRSREEAEKARRDESNKRNHCHNCGGTHR